MTSTLFWTSLTLLSVLLVWGAWSAYASWVETSKVRLRLDVIDKNQRGLRLQVSNLISMLIRAGFKRGKTVDWSDNEQETRSLDDSLSDSETRWFWRK